MEYTMKMKTTIALAALLAAGCYDTSDLVIAGQDPVRELARQGEYDPGRELPIPEGAPVNLVTVELVARLATTAIRYHYPACPEEQYELFLRAFRMSEDFDEETVEETPDGVMHTWAMRPDLRVEYRGAVVRTSGAAGAPHCAVAVIRND
jgi:hypothetical protein